MHKHLIHKIVSPLSETKYVRVFMLNSMQYAKPNKWPYAWNAAVRKGGCNSPQCHIAIASWFCYSVQDKSLSVYYSVDAETFKWNPQLASSVCSWCEWKKHTRVSCRKTAIAVTAEDKISPRYRCSCTFYHDNMQDTVKYAFKEPAYMNFWLKGTDLHSEELRS